VETLSNVLHWRTPLESVVGENQKSLQKPPSRGIVRQMVREQAYRLPELT